MKTPENFSDKVARWIGSTWSIVIHTFFFVGIFALNLVGVSSSDILLILTTAVSLEAIYLAIFIQMTVNQNAEDLEDLEEDLDEIQEELDEYYEEDEKDEEADRARLEHIEKTMESLLQHINELKKNGK